jgi:hypothetical protein
MTIFKRYTYLLALGILVAACDFGDTNISPTQVTAEQVTLRLILPKAQVQSAYNNAATGGRMAGIWMQYFQGVEAQQGAITNYSVLESDLNNTWSGQLYVGAMRDNITMLDKALTPGKRSPHYAGVARILLAHNLGFATQLWGDVPYTEAFKGTDNLNPTYDTQQSIFATVQTLLDSAIVNLSGSANGNELDADQDLIYGGVAASWIATARSLKARYYLMLSKRNGNAAYTSALAQLTAGAITSTATQPNFPFGASVNDANPIALFENDRPKTLQFDPTFAATILSGDPRASVYWGDGPSVAEPTRIYSFAGSSLYWGRNQSPLNLISYTEVKFIEAECLLMTGDIAGAETALNAAILANMAQVGATDGGYAATNSTMAGLTQSARLDRIISEKYKAMYGNGFTEAWTDYRRTGFPSFISAEVGAAESVLPRRMLYPQNERLTNGTSLAAATASQGGATLVDDMWAFE